MIVRELVNKIGFDVDFAKVAKAEAGFQRLASVASGLGSVFTALQATAIAGFVAAIPAALFATVRAVADVGDAALKTSQKIGVPVEAFQRLTYAAKLADLSQEGLTTSLKFLSRNLVDASEGGKETAEAFKKLGLDPKKYLKDTEGAIIAIADRVAAMPDGAEKTALSLKLLGKSGIEAIPFLNQGGTAIKEMGEEAELFGLIIREQATKQSEHFNDNLTRMGSIVLGLRNSIGGALLPVFDEVVNKMVEWYKMNGKVVKGGLTKFFEGVGKFIERIIPPLTRIGKAFFEIFSGPGKAAGENLVNIFQSLASYIEISLTLLANYYETIAKIVNSPLGQFIITAFVTPLKDAFIGLFLLLDDLAAYFRGDKSVTGEMIKAAHKVVDAWMTAFGLLFDYMIERFVEISKQAALLLNPITSIKAIRDLKSGKAFEGSSDTLARFKNSLSPIGENARAGGGGVLGPLLGIAHQAFENIRSSNVTNPNSGALLPSTTSPQAQANSVQNKNVNARGTFNINIPAGSLADDIRKAVTSSWELLLRQADNANSAGAV